jgi:hypothetical protein
VRRLFWVGVGVGLTVLAIHQLRKMQLAASPQGIADRVGSQASHMADRIAEFIETFNEATAEREAELRLAAGLEQEETHA